MVKKILYSLYLTCSLQISLLHADEVIPSIEFFEYLAEMEISDDGKNNSDWIDLLAMKEIENRQIIESTQEKGNE